MAEDLYREVILDHYKNPRGHGVMEDADAQAEGVNPLCGDEVSIYVQFADDGETLEEVKFSGRGCAISQASTSMLMEMVVGKTAGEISVGVYNLGGEFYAIEDRCSHDDGPLCEGEFDPEEGFAVCPRHGAHIDIRSGSPLTLPAVLPVETFPVTVEDGIVKVDLS